MKVVLINSWYGQTSTGKLVKSFHDYLISIGHTVTAFFGHGDVVNEDGVIKINSKINLYLHALLCRLTGYQGCYSKKNTLKIIDYISFEKPDVVYLFNLHAYYLNEFMLLSFLKSQKIKVVYMLFDEYPYLGKCCFSGECEKFKTECKNCPDIKGYPSSLFFDRSNFFFNKKRQLFEGWDELTLAGVQFLADRAKLSAIACNNRFVAFDMGVDLKNTYYPRDATELRKKLNIPDENKIVITVGYYSDKRKGIDKYFKIAEKCIDNPITFIHVGFDGNKERTFIPSNCILINSISSQEELATYYSLADVYVMTSSGEAMSLTCMESLGCGCKIIGFDISGTPYAASESFGKYIPYNDLDTFADEIIKAERKTDDSVNSCRQYALSRYEISKFVENLEKIGKDIPKRMEKKNE